MNPDFTMQKTKELNFGQALEALKAGRRVSRAGWNGKGMFIYLNKGAVDGSSVPSDSHPEVPFGKGLTIEGIDSRLFDRWVSGIVTRLPNINMRAASCSTVTGWLASQTDLLSEDWEILDPVSESKPDEMIEIPCQVIGSLRSSAQDLCYQIEVSGASPELTKASEMASDLQRRLNDLLPSF